MDSSVIKKVIKRKRRALRVRKKLRGTSSRPRLSVVKSNAHIFVQLIDDQNHQTLASTSTLSKEFKGTEFSKKSKASARKLGEKIAELAKAKNVETAIFDRGSHKYHGVIAEVAEGARAGGMKF